MRQSLPISEAVKTPIMPGNRGKIKHQRLKFTHRNPRRTNFPLWGSFAWVDAKDPTVSYIALAGAQVRETQYRKCVYDSSNSQFVSRVCLTVNGTILNLDPVFEKCQRFRAFVIPWIISTYSPGINITEDLPIITLRLFAGEGGLAGAAGADQNDEGQIGDEDRH